MKLQSGLLHLDGEPLQLEHWRQVAAHLSTIKTDIRGEVLDGPAFVSYRGDRITEEEDIETQPVRYGPYLLTFDGRLDNREELLLRIGTGAGRLLTDPEIVLRCYDRTGDAVFKHLIGEFALVLWCSRSQSLRFVRSACGARTLYYTIVNNTLFWASHLRTLVTICPVELDVNDRYALQYLVSQPSVRESPFANVEPSPPNRIVIVEGGRIKSSNEIWDPTEVPAVTYHTDTDYEEHLRDVMQAAVCRRMRSKQRLFAELSGGLDSSSVVLLADRVVRECGRDPQRLQTISCVYDPSSTCDESKFIASVEERRGVLTHRVTEQEQRMSTALEDSPPFTGVPNPLHCFSGRYPSFTNTLQNEGARLLLTGMGGDHLFWSDLDGGAIVADELFRGNLIAGHNECKAWSRCTNTPYYQLAFGRAVPLAAQSLLGRPLNFFPIQAPVWLHPRRRSECAHPSSNFDRFRNWRALPSKRAQVFVVEHFFSLVGAGLLAEYADIYVSHPYSYRPLVEFCLGVPIRQFLRDGHSRSLMRRAMREVLPNKIAGRASKGLADESIVRTLQNDSGRISSDLQDWEVCQREYAHHQLLLKSITQAQIGMLDGAGPLLKLLSLERWLRSLKNVSQLRRVDASAASGIPIHTRS